jgi:hypothetical protein
MVAQRDAPMLAGRRDLRESPRMMLILRYTIWLAMDQRAHPYLARHYRGYVVGSSPKGIPTIVD